MRRPLHLLLAVGLVLPVVTLTGAATPAAAAECPESGGAAITPATAAGDVVFRGGGWGHGLGMSQYGAQGAARLGCTYDQILTRYYAGTEVTSRQMPDVVRLRMLQAGYRVDVHAVDGALTWVLPGCVPPTTPPTPTTPPCPPVQPQGAKWQLTVDPATTQYVLWSLGVIPKAEVWRGGSADQPLRLQQSGVTARVTTWRGSSIYLDRWLRWDWTRFSITAAGRLDAVQYVEPSPVGSAMDKYLWGIAEVPASFPAEALKAQAVAARTYAAKRSDRVLMPTPADQNYTGAKKETEGTGGVWGAAWKAAVDATSGQVVGLAGGGTMIDAFYSSSMGGHTEDERYVWGQEAPFLRAVDDSRWDLASSNPVEKRSWAVGVSWATLAKKLGFQHVSAVSVPARGDATRVGGVRVTGVRGGQVTTAYVEGWDVRQAFGLLSPGFTISFSRVGGPRAQPIAGDWDGDGDDEPGWFRNGAVALSMTTKGTKVAAWTKRYRFGRTGDVAVVGDWDRNGTDEVGLFRNGTWLLRSSQSSGSPTKAFDYGKAGDRPVVGSWNGKKLGIGVVRGNRWLLRRSLSAGRVQWQFGYGRAGDVPVVGAWTGTRRSGIGVVRDGTWLLRNRRSTGRPGVTFAFGQPGDRPVVGDWDGDGRASAGVVRARTFLLRAGIASDASAPARTFRG